MVDQTRRQDVIMPLQSTSLAPAPSVSTVEYPAKVHGDNLFDASRASEQHKAYLERPLKVEDVVETSTFTTPSLTTSSQTMLGGGLRAEDVHFVNKEAERQTYNKFLDRQQGIVTETKISPIIAPTHLAVDWIGRTYNVPVPPPLPIGLSRSLPIQRGAHLNGIYEAVEVAQERLKLMGQSAIIPEAPPTFATAVMDTATSAVESAAPVVKQAATSVVHAAEVAVPKVASAVSTAASATASTAVHAAEVAAPAIANAASAAVPVVKQAAATTVQAAGNAAASTVHAVESATPAIVSTASSMVRRAQEIVQNMAHEAMEVIRHQSFLTTAAAPAETETISTDYHKTYEQVAQEAALEGQKLRKMRPTLEDIKLHHTVAQEAAEVGEERGVILGEMKESERNYLMAEQLHVGKPLDVRQMQSHVYVGPMEIPLEKIEDQHHLSYIHPEETRQLQSPIFKKDHKIASMTQLNQQEKYESIPSEASAETIRLHDRAAQEAARRSKEFLSYPKKHVTPLVSTQPIAIDTVQQQAKPAVFSTYEQKVVIFEGGESAAGATAAYNPLTSGLSSNLTDRDRQMLVDERMSRAQPIQQQATPSFSIKAAPQPVATQSLQHQQMFQYRPLVSEGGAQRIQQQAIAQPMVQQQAAITAKPIVQQQAAVTTQQQFVSAQLPAAQQLQRPIQQQAMAQPIAQQQVLQQPMIQQPMVQQTQVLPQQQQFIPSQQQQFISGQQQQFLPSQQQFIQQQPLMQSNMLAQQPMFYQQQQPMMQQAYTPSTITYVGAPAEMLWSAKSGVSGGSFSVASSPYLYGTVVQPSTTSGAGLLTSTSGQSALVGPATAGVAPLSTMGRVETEYSKSKKHTGLVAKVKNLLHRNKEGAQTSNP